MKPFYLTLPLCAAVLLSSSTVLAQAQRPRTASGSQPQKPENKSLRPSNEARVKYAQLLKSGNTRLLVLLPRETYDPHVNGRRIVSTIPNDDTPTLGTPVAGSTEGAFTHLSNVQRIGAVAQGRKSGDVRGGGAYYSFTYRTHNYGDASHLSLSRGKFAVGFSGAAYGFLTDLGDVPLESVSLNTPAANLPATYERASREGIARSEHRRFADGVVVDGITFKRELPMVPNSTYVLRAVNYGNSDVLVAFKVVEVESDGAALILWKLLKRYSTPQLER